MKELRLIPMVIVAVAGLLALKAAAIGIGGTAFGETGQGAGQVEGAMERMFGRETAGGARDAVLESLGERRRTLETRERELDERERLLAATESRVEERIAELAELESRLGLAMDERRAQEEQRFAGLVRMYETMRPKEAARILDGLEMPILVRVAREMNPRAMAEILAQMRPVSAQRLTVELSEKRRDDLRPDEPADELPRIVGTLPAR